MRIIDCEQGSPEWVMARLGVATASQFHRLVTPARLEPSKQLRGYGMELLAEWLQGEPQDDGGRSDWSDRGIAKEPQAIAAYEWEHGIETRAVGFCLSADGSYGCSPDRLVGDDGGVEIKCHAAKIHIGYLLDGFHADHMMQVQGSLLVTGREWWDLVAFCPGLPSVGRRVVPDPRYQDALRAALDNLVAFLAESKARLLESGCTSRLDALRAQRTRDEAWVDSVPESVPVGARKTMAEEDFEGEVGY